MEQHLHGRSMRDLERRSADADTPDHAHRTLHTGTELLARIRATPPHLRVGQSEPPTRTR